MLDANLDFELPKTNTIVGEGGSASILLGRLKNAQLIRKFGFVEIAVKVIPNSESSQDSERKQQAFLYEVAIMQAVGKCPNIVSFVGFTDKPCKCIVMKMYQTNLKDILHKGAFNISPQVIMGMAHDIANGLSKIHKSGIVHLDIKPRKFDWL